MISAILTDVRVVSGWSRTNRNFKKIICLDPYGLGQRDETDTVTS